jgi:hypothetical protein
MGLMKGNRSLFIVVGVVAVLIAAWWFFWRGGSSSAVSLIDRFAAAEKRPGDPPDLFAVEDVTIDNDTKRSITIKPTAGTRVKFKTHVPDDAWLRVSVALKPEAWTLEGDGIRFLALVSDGRSSNELFTQDINPFQTPTDRRWIPLMVDLSGYAGEEVEIILNTYASAPGRGSDTRNDLAVWGAPEIVIR